MTLSFPIYFSSLPLPCIRWQMKRTWLINNTPGEFLSHRELLADLAGLSCVGGPSSLYWPAKAPGPHSRGATDEGSQRKNAWGLASGRKTGERTNEYDRDWMVPSSYSKFKLRADAQTCAHTYEMHLRWLWSPEAWPQLSRWRGVGRVGKQGDVCWIQGSHTSRWMGLIQALDPGPPPPFPADDPCSARRRSHWDPASHLLEGSQELPPFKVALLAWQTSNETLFGGKLITRLVCLFNFLLCKFPTSTESAHR